MLIRENNASQKIDAVRELPRRCSRLWLFGKLRLDVGNLIFLKKKIDVK